MNSPQINNSGDVSVNRYAMLRTLAAVGFIAIVGGSMLLAIYSTRFVPAVVSRLGSAAVYVGSVFSPAAKPDISVVPSPSEPTTIPFDVASSSVPTAESPATSTPVNTASPAPTKPAAPIQGPKTVSTVQIGGGAATASTPQSGLPDFVVTIDSVGYLATTSADSFVTSSTVPSGSRPAVKFTIKNVGGNESVPWRFSATIPTQTAYIYQSQAQQALAAGDSIDYVLGFDQSNKGAGQLISITANYDHAVAESNPDNNSSSASITVIGS